MKRINQTPNDCFRLPKIPYMDELENISFSTVYLAALEFLTGFLQVFPKYFGRVILGELINQEILF